MVRTPTYHAFWMYRPFQGAAMLPVTVDSPMEAAGANKLPAVDVTAARATDGTLELALVNIDPDQAADVDLDIAGSAAPKIVGQILTGPKMDSRNAFGTAEQVRPEPFTRATWSNGKLHVSMPAKSIVVLAVK